MQSPLSICTQASCSDTEFDELMKEYQLARQMLEDIETLLSKFYYDRLRKETILSSTQADSNGSHEETGSRSHANTEEAQSPLTSPVTSSLFSNYWDRESVPKPQLEHTNLPQKEGKEKKQRKKKAQKTEDQINRHINKVFMRENISKDLFKALEILRTAPEDTLSVLLQDLRSKRSVSEFLQSIDSTPSPLNPLTTSLAGTFASSALELDLNMRFSGAFPHLETLEISDVDLQLLEGQRQAPVPLNTQAIQSRLSSSLAQHSEPGSETPKSSGSFSSSSDTIRDARQYTDPRLENIRVWQWTSVPISDALAAQAISFYLVNEHPVLALFDANLFIKDFVTGGQRFCSPLLVSSFLAWCCASYSQFEPRAQALSLHLLTEAKIRWKERQSPDAITTLSAAMFLVLTCNQHGQDRVGLLYLDASADIGRRLGLFGDDDTPTSDMHDEDDDVQSAASFAAWGAFGWHTIWYQAAIMVIWRPFLGTGVDKYMARNGTPSAAYEASVRQLKRLVYLYRKRFETTNLTMFITPGLLSLINEVFRKPDAPDAQFCFILCARGCLSIAGWCRGLRGITEGLMSIGWQSGVFRRPGWTNQSMIEGIRVTTRTLAGHETYSSLYPINLDPTTENIEDISMEVLAREFRRLTCQYERRERNVEMVEQSWKGDPRDLSLTLSEATEPEEYI
ncbi:hypothetical protein F66182_10816 [Fusarium sp. NRRL 66182]|nr:hypothetical protein F66182_10816 [Fusarium sp. NRRL 66182]